MRLLRRGFSYIEIVVSIGVLVIILGLLLAVLVVLPANRYANHEDIALRIANHEVETLRALGYSGLPATGTFADTSLSTLPSGTATMTITDYNAKVKKVVVTVSWSEGATPRQVQLTTLMTDVGGLP